MTGRIQRVLLLGPDGDRRTLHLVLDRAGKQVSAVNDREAALRYLASEEPCDVVIAPADDAVALAHHAPVIAIVPTREPAAALALLEAGVADIVSAPIDELAVLLALRRVPTRAPRAFGSGLGLARAIVGDSEAMQKLRATIEQIARHKTTVLVLGESGTGKELVARAIHDASPRRDHRFVAINCAAIPAPLLESELFGHVRGAFTDAVRDKAGLFQDADGGTLLLDEIGELPRELQAKLLRVLQQGEIRRVGDNATIAVDVRVIAATLRDLEADVAAGSFREDLYYRINVLQVRVPPLRERAEDIPQLVRFFARRVADRHSLETVRITDEAIATLARQPWVGNVRELENVIERTVVLADGPIDDAFLASVMTVRGAKPAETAAEPPDPSDLSIKKATRDLEADLIRRALGVTAGNRTNAAKLLEISHRALLYKMKEYGIS